jgi:hypothetical protein
MQGYPRSAVPALPVISIRIDLDGPMQDDLATAQVRSQ